MNLAVMPLHNPMFVANTFTPPGEGTDYQVIRDQWLQARIHYEYPITRQTRTRTFRGLIDTWKSDRGPTSSMTELIMHPAYQRIIGMGPAVIPFLLAELEQQPDHWFWALYAITGANPVRPEDAGNLQRMTAAWLNWGKEQGYRWWTL